MKLRILHLVVFVLLIAAIAGVTWAWAQDNGTVYYACVNNNSGAIKVFMEETPCSTSETPISWNQTGPPGPSGLSKAYAASQDTTILTGEPLEGLQLTLPAGNFINTVVLSAAAREGVDGGYLACGFSNYGPGIVGGSLPQNDVRTFSRTFRTSVANDDTLVWFSCDPQVDEGYIELYWAEWTVIQVDSVDYQE